MLRPDALGRAHEFLQDGGTGIFSQKLPQRRRDGLQGLQHLRRLRVRAEALLLQQGLGIHGHRRHDEDRQDDGKAVHDHGRRDLLDAQGVADKARDHHDLHIGRDHHEQEGRQPQQRQARDEIKGINPGQFHPRPPAAHRCPVRRHACG